jgi:outer membrane immunogenic protein
MFFRSVLPVLIVILMAPAASAQSRLGDGEWAGPYAGVSVGAARSEGAAALGDFDGFIVKRDVVNGLFPPRIDGGSTSLTGGGAIGYNIQRGAVVTGVELDLSLLDHEVTHRFSRIDPTAPPDPFAGVETITTYGTEFGALATLRLRAGLAQGRTLYYLTGGLAAAEVTNRLSLALPELGEAGYANSWSKSGFRIGFAVGAGLERALSDRMRLRAEFVHFDLENVTVRAEDPPVFGDNRFDYRYRNRGQLVRVGVAIPF